MQIGELRQWLAEHGARPAHTAYVLRRWLQALPEDRGPTRPAHHLGRRLREAIAAPGSPFNALAGPPSRWHSEDSPLGPDGGLTGTPSQCAGGRSTLGRPGALVRERSSHPAEDGAVRLLLELRSGQTIESVLLPGGGLCVSTQVGCAVGCRFCMTGRDGLVQQLGSAEIVAQVAAAAARVRASGAPAATRDARALVKVVFMGMGEPAHNLDAVCEAIELLGDEGAIAHKNLVFSTVGDARVFERLARLRVRPALALSLHTTCADKRARLLPRAPRIDPADLVECGERYARATGYPVQVQWTLLEGVNDGDDELAGIARLLAGKYAVLNLIPFNDVAGTGFRRPSWSRAAEIARTLHRRGILTKLRHSAGQEVEAGCGQLRARAISPQRLRLSAAN